MICNRQAGDVFKREVSQQGMGTRYPIPLFAWNGVSSPEETRFKGATVILNGLLLNAWVINLRRSLH